GVDEREDAGASYREKSHRFRETVDGSAPLLIQQEQDGGNQRAGVADTDPPDEIDDRKAPANGNVDAPDADALDDEPGDSNGQQHHDGEGEAKAGEPAHRNRTREDDRGNFVGDRGVAVPRFDHRRKPADFRRVVGTRATHALSISGFGLRTAA